MYNIYDLVPKGAHARGYALQLKIKRWKLFLFEMLCNCMNEWIYSTDNFWQQPGCGWFQDTVITHQKTGEKNDCQKWTSMEYQVIFATLLTNKPQAHGVTITDLYLENIILYG